MSYLNDEQRLALLSHADRFMAETPNSLDADTLVALVKRVFANPVLVAMFPSQKLTLYKLILEEVAFVASKLTRRKPELPLSDVAKSKRAKQKSFYYNGFDTLVDLCRFELLSIVPEGKWTDMHAASFLQTLESIDPILSRLFTKVFDDLITRKDQLKEVFSSDFFRSFSMVVRPDLRSDFDVGFPESKVQRDYGLKYHYRFPMTSSQLFAILHRELSGVEV